MSLAFSHMCRKHRVTQNWKFLTPGLGCIRAEKGRPLLPESAPPVRGKNGEGKSVS